MPTAGNSQTVYFTYEVIAKPQNFEVVMDRSSVIAGKTPVELPGVGWKNHLRRQAAQF
jgi:hypothetical protein